MISPVSISKISNNYLMPKPQKVLNGVQNVVSNAISKSANSKSVSKALPLVTAPLVAAMIFKKEKSLEEKYPYGYHKETREDHNGMTYEVEVANKPPKGNPSYGTHEEDVIVFEDIISTQVNNNCPYAGKEAPVDEKGRLILPDNYKQAVNDSNEKISESALSDEATSTSLSFEDRVSPENMWKYEKDEDGNYPFCDGQFIHFLPDGSPIDMRDFGQVLKEDLKDSNPIEDKVVSDSDDLSFGFSDPEFDALMAEVNKEIKASQDLLVSIGYKTQEEAENDYPDLYSPSSEGEVDEGSMLKPEKDQDDVSFGSSDPEFDALMAEVQKEIAETRDVIDNIENNNFGEDINFEGNIDDIDIDDFEYDIDDIDIDDEDEDDYDYDDFD